jgi:hypothetical protein
MNPGPVFSESIEKLACIVSSRSDPEIDVFRECGGAVENGGLTADQKIFEADTLKAAEKSSHRDSS